MEPHVQFFERLRPQLVDALLRRGVHFDEPGVAEHVKVFRDLRLAEPELVDNFSHWARPVAQEFDNVQAVRVCQSSQGGFHDLYIPQRAYSVVGIYEFYGRAATQVFQDYFIIRAVLVLTPSILFIRQLTTLLASDIVSADTLTIMS